MLVLVGPSASGKTEVAKYLIKNYGMRKLVTYTTRPMRVGEVEGVDYHFVNHDFFLEKIPQNFFLETVEYNNQFYGTAFEDLAPDKVVILEPNGVKNYLAKVPKEIKICYLKTPIEYRYKRMLARGDDEESIQKRLAGDDAIFTSELETLADWTILSDDISVGEMAEWIYQKYQPNLKSKPSM